MNDLGQSNATHMSLVSKPGTKPGVNQAVPKPEKASFLATFQEESDETVSIDLDNSTAPFEERDPDTPEAHFDKSEEPDATPNPDQETKNTESSGAKDSYDLQGFAKARVEAGNDDQINFDQLRHPLGDLDSDRARGPVSDANDTHLPLQLRRAASETSADQDRNLPIQDQRQPTLTTHSIPGQVAFQDLNSRSNLQKGTSEIASSTLPVNSPLSARRLIPENTPNHDSASGSTGGRQEKSDLHTLKQAASPEKITEQSIQPIFKTRGVETSTALTSPSSRREVSNPEPDRDRLISSVAQYKPTDGNLPNFVVKGEVEPNPHGPNTYQAERAAPHRQSIDGQGLRVSPPWTKTTSPAAGSEHDLAKENPSSVGMAPMAQVSDKLKPASEHLPKAVSIPAQNGLATTAHGPVVSPSAVSRNPKFVGETNRRNALSDVVVHQPAQDAIPQHRDPQDRFSSLSAGLNQNSRMKGPVQPLPRLAQNAPNQVVESPGLQQSRIQNDPLIQSGSAQFRSQESGRNHVPTAGPDTAKMGNLLASDSGKLAQPEQQSVAVKPAALFASTASTASDLEPEPWSKTADASAYSVSKPLRLDGNTNNLNSQISDISPKKENPPQRLLSTPPVGRRPDSMAATGSSFKGAEHVRTETQTADNLGNTVSAVSNPRSIENPVPTESEPLTHVAAVTKTAVELPVVRGSLENSNETGKSGWFGSVRPEPLDKHIQTSVASSAYNTNAQTPALSSQSNPPLTAHDIGPPSLVAQPDTELPGSVSITPTLSEGVSQPERSFAQLAPSPKPQAQLHAQPMVQVIESLRATPGKSIEIVLRPEELGMVRMTLTPSDGAIVLGVEADQSETLDLMKRHIGDLRSELLQMGYDSVDIDFTQHDENRDHSENPSNPETQSSLDQTSVGEPAQLRSIGTGVDMRV